MGSESVKFFGPWKEQESTFFSHELNFTGSHPKTRPRAWHDCCLYTEASARLPHLTIGGFRGAAMTMQSWGIEPAVAPVTAGSATSRLRRIVSRSLRLPNCSSPMQPIFGPSANTELSLIERTLLRQANLRASERCALADVDLKAHLAQVSSIAGDGEFASASLPPDLLVSLRVSVEDFTSN